MNRDFEVRKEIQLDATPDQVWEAIATGPGLEAWFMPMPMDPDSDLVEAWEPGERLAIRTPTDEDGSVQAFEYLIEARDGSTSILRFVHRGVTGEGWGDEFEAMTSAGWDMYLFTLAQYFTHFAGRPATYAEAEGPDATTDPATWGRIIAALGIAGKPRVGAAAELALDGIGPLAGTVDYVSATFVGLRTDDALIRFHLRAPIGMTVAVSHHAYASGFDAGATAAAWQRWLAGAVA